MRRRLSFMIRMRLLLYYIGDEYKGCPQMSGTSERIGVRGFRHADRCNAYDASCGVASTTTIGRLANVAA
jgi:hypothetical protein